MLLTVLPLELQLLPPCISGVRGSAVCVGGLSWKEERDFFLEE